MRCVIVNRAKLKAEALCAHCRNKIGEGYVREVGSRVLYCNFRCYSIAIEAHNLAPSPSNRGLALGGWSSR